MFGGSKLRRREVCMWLRVRGCTILKVFRNSFSLVVGRVIPTLKLEEFLTS
jgi:hypothetical protein